MALTNTDQKVQVAKQRATHIERVYTVTIGTYTTNGLALIPADVGMTGIVFLFAHPSAGYVFEYDYTNQKLKAYYDNSAASYTQNQPLGEVANSANLAAVTTRAYIIGY